MLTKSTDLILRLFIPGITLIIFIASIYMLNFASSSDVPTAASKLMFERGQVLTVISDNASPDTWTEGLRLGTQEVLVLIDSGEYEGEELIAVNYLTAYGNTDLKVGSHIIVRLDLDDNLNPYIASVSNYNRSYIIVILALIFFSLLIFLGGKKGLAAALGLIFTILSIWLLLIPLIEKGFPPIPGAIIVVSVTAVVSLSLLNGYSKKTFIAAVGCIGGVTIAGLIAFIAGVIAPINGFNMPEAEELILRTSDSGLQVSGLLVSGILIASLGAVMDVALTITSAVAELHEMNPKASTAQLFKSGLNIGRDAMGTMANTLILAFAGASLNMLVLFRVFDYPYIQIFNSDLMTIEIIQGLAGSIGIVLTVPLVAALSGFMFGKK